jgi:hypothetical protein
MSVLQLNNMFLNVPKELWGSMITLFTFESFCSCWKVFYEMKETFAKGLLLKLTGLSLPLRDESCLLSEGFTFSKFMSLFENKTQFHRIAPFIGEYNIMKTPMPLLTNIIVPAMGVENSLQFSGNLWCSRILEDGDEVRFLKNLPIVTFLLPKSFTKSNSNYHIANTADIFATRTGMHKYSIIDTLNDFCCQTKKDITQQCLLYARKMVLSQQSADCLVPLIQNNFPVLPPVKRFANDITEIQEMQKEYLDFLLNTKSVVHLYFDVLMNPAKDVPYNNKTKLWFLYYTMLHPTSLAFKTFQLFSGAIPKNFIDIVTSKRFTSKTPRITMDLFNFP